MTDQPVILPAKLCYLTEPKPGCVVISLHTEQGAAQAILSPQQLANIVIDGARAMRPFVEGES